VLYCIGTMPEGGLTSVLAFNNAHKRGRFAGAESRHAISQPTDGRNLPRSISTPGR
jgi:hypothetical protein